MHVTVPHNFTPRFYQIPFFKAMDSGKRRACLIWHRRSGKTKSLVNFTTKKMFERVGTYYHCFPEYSQGRKILWDGIDADGNRVLEHHIPQVLRKATNKTEMKIEMINGSLWQIIGADNYDSLVGPNPVGLILDEWAVSSKYPMAWDYFRPILTENKGWAVFPYTPRGRTHGWDLYQMSLRNPNWFSQLLTVDTTNVVSRFDIEEERASGMSEDMIQQEYYCSFLASTEDILIPFFLIQQALDHDIDYGRSGRIAGCDPARFGNDRNGFVIRQAGQVIHVDSWGGLDTVQSAGKLISLYEAGIYDCVAIDVIGVGAGIFDMVKNAGIPCVAVNVSEATTDNSQFVRQRDELWWKARQWFEEPGCSISPVISEAKKKEFLSDIQDIRFEYNAKGQIKVEKKEKMKERLGFSPDTGDAFIHTFHPAIKMKVKQIDKTPFGRVVNPFQKKQNDYNPLRDRADYNPLTFGLGGDR